MGPQGEGIPDLSYFICTLGEASALNSKKPHNFTTVNEFIDHQAKHSPNLLAVGFPPGGTQASKSSEIFTFSDLYNGSIAVAHELNDVLGHSTSKALRKCVALLCPSSIDFLFVWLGLMRLGRSVLLIAPQCQPAAIAHLCRSCNAMQLLCDNSYEQLAQSSACEPGASFIHSPFPWQVSDASIFSIIRSPHKNAIFHTPKIAATDEAYIFHTSGTSTGLPKPIPQSHHAGIGVLPCLDGQKAATFTTTPLYHGGIADCFRAWTSNAMIWLFPAATKAITPKNIIWSLSTAKRFSRRNDAPTVKYFSSVPYVLQMLAEDIDGLTWLQVMEIVGVGGAALPPGVGDNLVSLGVNLVSRFGSAECGFLLSSHRNYQTDKDWQYLRVPMESKFLRFEEQSDGSGLSELAILKGWPCMAKTNRPDGSYATSDLFEPHPSIANAWKYHSRSDSQITLITGKKFDPAPMEDALASSSALIQDVMVFGSGRQFPGALVFPSDEGEKLTEGELRDEVWEELQKLNNKGQDHTRISKDMVLFVTMEKGPLAKSSKGTVLRGVEEVRFGQEIEKAYDQGSEGAGEALPDAEILPFVRKAVRDVLGHQPDLDDHLDLYSHGVDSMKATQIRGLLQRAIRINLPWNVVYDGGNISGLAQVLLDLREGKTTQKDESEYMLELVKKYSSTCVSGKDSGLGPLVEATSNGSIGNGKTVLLTGATGSLGAHILDLLTACESISQIVCLVRAKDLQDARQRVDESLKKRRRPALNQQQDLLVVCLPAKLGEEILGLNVGELLEVLNLSQAAIFIHAAWDVNFSLPLESFVGDQIGGLASLLRLTYQCHKPVRFLYCSSTASVLGPSHTAVISESISTSPEDSNALGYAKSKWVAEAICSKYGETVSKSNSIAVLRIGQLTGHTQTGVWNMTEAWPLMLSTVKQLGCLPDLDETLSWLPVDVAAMAVVEIALQDEIVEERCPVYHLVNNATVTKWRDLLSWLKGVDGLEFEIVSPGIWMERLEGLESHPAKALLGLWRGAYGNGQEGDNSKPKADVHFKTDKTEAVAEAMKGFGLVDEELVRKIWAWMDGELATIVS